MYFSVIAAMMMLGASEGGKTALLLVDVQECFLETGTLPVANASSIIPNINSIRSQKSCLFDKVVMSQDYHQAGHLSFASTHGKAPGLGAWQGLLAVTCLKPTSGKTADASCCPTYYVNKSAVDCTSTYCPAAADFYTKAPGNAIITGNTACATCASDPSQCFSDIQSMWSDHCLQNGDSAIAENLTKEATDLIVQKGTNKYVDAYSAFMDNSGNLKTTLDASLQAAGIDTLYVAGIATDVCVKWTLRDAFSAKTGNYTIKVIKDASAGIYAGTGTANEAEAMAYFENLGATVVTTEEILATKCPQAQLSVAATPRSILSFLLTLVSIFTIATWQ